MEQFFKKNSSKLGLEITFSKFVDFNEISSTTEVVYEKAWAMAREQGFLEVLRVWNFIPKINEFTNGIENYQHFCQGRKAAYGKLQLQSESFPAASAVGSNDGQIHFRFLFGQEKPAPITNRLQVEAYHYPNDYGPTPPSFARAAVLNSTIFLSGTASIRGHKTMFAGDLDAQLRCTLENIEEVLNEARIRTRQKIDKNSIAWRVYLREPHVRKIIEPLLLSELGTKVEYIAADICRSDLLIEIEGMTNGL